MKVKAQLRCHLHSQSSLQATHGNEKKEKSGSGREPGKGQLNKQTNTEAGNTRRKKELLPGRTWHNKRAKPPAHSPHALPRRTYQTVLIVLGHLVYELVQLQAAGTNDLDPEVVWMFRGRDVHLQELIGVETEVRTGD